MKKCLIVTDLQQGFITRETQFLIRDIEDLAVQYDFDCIVSSKFINEKNSRFERDLKYKKMTETEDTCLASAFIKERSDLIYEKRYYSCFTDELKTFIAQNEIDKLYIVGLETDASILKSAFDAFELGYDFIVIEDYCFSTRGKSAHNTAIKLMDNDLGKKNILPLKKTDLKKR